MKQRNHILVGSAVTVTSNFNLVSFWVGNQADRMNEFMLFTDLKTDITEGQNDLGGQPVVGARLFGFRITLGRYVTQSF